MQSDEGEGEGKCSKAALSILNAGKKFMMSVIKVIFGDGKEVYSGFHIHT
jgi:hypothetical protein